MSVVPALGRLRQEDCEFIAQKKKKRRRRKKSHFEKYECRLLLDT
jgi:hypothetical protein